MSNSSANLTSQEKQQLLETLTQVFGFQSVAETNKHLISWLQCPVEKAKAMFDVESCIIHKLSDDQARKLFLNKTLNRREEYRVQKTNSESQPPIKDVYVMGGLTITLALNLVTLKNLIKDRKIKGTDWTLHICDPKSKAPDSLQAKTIARMMGAGETNLPPHGANYTPQAFTKWCINRLTPGGKTLCKGLDKMGQMDSVAFFKRMEQSVSADSTALVVSDNADKVWNFLVDAGYFKESEDPDVSRLDHFQKLHPTTDYIITSQLTREDSLNKALFFNDPLRKELLIMLNDFANGLPKQE